MKSPRFWFVPLGKYLGVKSTKASPPPFNATLEKAYKKKSKLDNETVKILANKPIPIA
jgi:hypothetical protein